MTRFVFLRSRSSTQIPYTFEQHCMMKVYISLFVKQMAAIRPGTASCFFFFFLPSDQKNSRRKAVSPLFFLPLLYPLSIVHFLKSDYSVTNGRRRDCFHDFLLLPVTEQWTWSALTGENLTKNVRFVPLVSRDDVVWEKERNASRRIKKVTALDMLIIP